MQVHTLLNRGNIPQLRQIAQSVKFIQHRVTQQTIDSKRTLKCSISICYGSSLTVNVFLFLHYYTMPSKSSYPHGRKPTFTPTSLELSPISSLPKDYERKFLYLKEYISNHKQAKE